MEQTAPSLPHIPVFNKPSGKSRSLWLVIAVVLLVLIAAGLFLFLKMKPLQKQPGQQSRVDQSSSSPESPATTSSQPSILAVTIDEVSGNTLKVTVSPPAGAQTKQYTVLFDDKTEIWRSRIYDDSSKPIKETRLSASSFEKGKQIVVYTYSNYDSSDKLNAYRIEVLPKNP